MEPIVLVDMVCIVQYIKLYIYTVSIWSCIFYTNIDTTVSSKNVESLSPILHIKWYLNPQKK